MTQYARERDSLVCLFARERQGLVCLFAREREGLVAEFEVLVIGNLEWGPVTLEETKK